MTLRPPLRDTLGKLIKWRLSDKLARSVRKGQEKRLEKGEITIEDYKRAVEDQQGVAQGSGDRGDRNTLQGTVLANGPTGHAWSDAILALRYAIPLALVPGALAMYEFAASWETSFPAVTFVLRMMLSFAYSAHTCLLFRLFLSLHQGEEWPRKRNISGGWSYVSLFMSAPDRNAVLGRLSLFLFLGDASVWLLHNTRTVFL